MPRSSLATLWLIAISTFAPLQIVIFGLSGPPNFVGYSLAMLLVLATAIKFALAEMLSSEGFNMEKTACDMALALCTALTSLAIVQQFQADHIILPIGWMFNAPTNDPVAALSEARAGMWQIAGSTALFLFLSVSLAHEARRLRGAVGRWQRFARASCRIGAVLLGSICYTLYYLSVLLKA